MQLLANTTSHYARIARISMIEGMQRLEALASTLAGERPGTSPPMLDAICAIVLYDYQQFRYGEQPWLPATPGLRAISEAFQQRPSFARTMPITA